MKYTHLWLLLGAFLTRPSVGAPVETDHVPPQSGAAPAEQSEVTPPPERLVPVAKPPVVEAPPNHGRPPFPHQPDKQTRIVGRLVNSAGGPVPGVGLILRIGRDGRSSLATKSGFKRYAEWRYPSARSGEDGCFTFGDLDPRGWHELEVRRNQPYMATTVEVKRLRAGETSDFGDATLYRPARVRGKVVDSSGKPVEDAPVRIGRPVTPGDSFFVSDNPMVKRVDRVVFRLFQHGKPTEGLTDGPRCLGPGLSLTDAAGEFELVDVEPGTYVVSCRHQGYRDSFAESVGITEGATVGPLRLVLEEALAISVVVLDHEGRPVKGAQVRVRGEEEREKTTFPSQQLITNENGKARFEGLQARKVNVLVVADGHTTAKISVAIVQEDQPVEIILQPGGEMFGRVIDGSSGEPMAGGFGGLKQGLFVTRSVLESVGGVVGRGIHVEDGGVFRERGLEPGPYRLTVRCNGYDSVKLGPRVLKPGGTIDWGTIKLRHGGRIDVLVVDVSGSPVEGAKVDSQYGPSRSKATDAAGRVTLQVSSGTVRLHARHPDFAAGWSEPIKVGKGIGDISVTITLTRGGTVTGIAYDGDGSILVGGSVILTTSSHNHVRSAERDADGRFRFENVTPGRYRLHIEYRPVSHKASPEFQVEDGQTVVQDARQPPRRRLEGTVIDAAGLPLVSCGIGFGTPVPAPNGTWIMPNPTCDIETDESGKFTIFDARPPAIQVTTAGGARHVFAVPRDANALVLQLPGETDDQATSVIRGVVSEVGGGAVIAGASVVLATAPSDDAEGATLLRRFESASDVDGRWEFKVPDGRYVVEVGRSELGTEKHEVILTAGRTEVVDVALWRAGSLEFEFPREDTKIRQPGRITVEASIIGQPSTVRTKHGYPGGRAILTKLRAGATYSVRFSATGFKTITRSLEAAEGNTKPVLVSMEAASTEEGIEGER